MKEGTIKTLIKSGILRARQTDKEKIKSMINSAEVNAAVARNISLNEDSATLIFREIYESIRQLGDAFWWFLGYEPANHEISLDILQELPVEERVKLNFLGRFKQIRHDANYKGFRVSIPQAKEIIDFWDICGREMIKLINKKLQNNRI